jgi:16S rRNA A1518/A1519 N6-dimethyltransferase RsmA/KsgA/DIM1 with predicted DNA glycosylase/AP lyase activity
MIFLSLGLLLILLCFGFVLLFGAPYLPTLAPQVRAALELANVKPGETLLELGCGDGKILLAAAHVGVKSVGYELNPILALIARIRTLKYRKTVTIIWGDFWQKPWPEAEAIFVFLLPKYMKKLDTKIMQSKHKPVKLVSFAFEVPGKTASEQKDGVFLYDYDV